MTKTEKEVAQIALPIVESLGYELYDVEYVKEGKDYFLRFYIDRASGIDLDDCERVSNELNTRLDEVDPIDTQYFLEVSSCGLERHLREPEHFNKAVGKNVQIKLYKAIDDEKVLEGTLENCVQNEITLKVDSKVFKIDMKNIAAAKILYEWEE